MLAALGNVRPSHLFDKGLWARLGISTAADADDARAGSGPAPDVDPLRLARGGA